MTGVRTRIIVVLQLIVLGSLYGFVGYVSFGLNEALTPLARWISARQDIPTVQFWDSWFFFAIGPIAVLAAAGILFRKSWMRALSLDPFGASGLWATVVALAPESWRGVWFSIWMDRWAAALVAGFSLVGFILALRATGKSVLQVSETTA